MTEIITADILDNFKKITLYDVKVFLNDYITFTDVHYPNITNFFSGVSDISPAISIRFLNNLQKEQKKIVDLVILNSNSFTNYQYWALVEYIEDIGSSLETAANTSRWLRSSRTINGYKQQVITDYMLNQGQDLEGVERDVLKSNDPDGWVNTALENGLREEDYDKDGGALIKVIYKNNSSLFLNSVVDNIDTAEKTYGKDIDRYPTIEDDDLVVLSYQDTVKQSAKILISLAKGDDPAFKDRGIDVHNIVGSNIAAVSYPTIFRQLAGNFATDDSFKSVSIQDIVRQQDAIVAQVQIQTKAGDFFNDQIGL